VSRFIYHFAECHYAECCGAQLESRCMQACHNLCFQLSGLFSTGSISAQCGHPSTSSKPAHAFYGFQLKNEKKNQKSTDFHGITVKSHSQCDILKVMAINLHNFTSLHQNVFQ
jgi:hypothetical protein